ncbi:hypothetical protein CC85DRAFT_330821 [Cutaneotrichosporon oleaginosum]|uniref:Myb-like domain-containing protein n=1 Tax=Cutaneotrichosporon oleaginosum TaxID=879819 RepID=A0A0J0XE12_9TREE|nr:uncharacterized protein CC85DRAFT_330821 [Cutaneotrichosporon oleaginosum]KLT39336.1 hypothetical protein CC85DRAFT_330821 [Cutaneotrichosporon oleaginosum]TXT08532.1 hypothetical protein COLE_05456 [Cutaneotrichosporon oleaginosum]
MPKARSKKAAQARRRTRRHSPSPSPQPEPEADRHSVTPLEPNDATDKMEALEKKRVEDEDKMEDDDVKADDEASKVDDEATTADNEDAGMLDGEKAGSPDPIGATPTADQPTSIELADAVPISTEPVDAVPTVIEPADAQPLSPAPADAHPPSPEPVDAQHTSSTSPMTPTPPEPGGAGGTNSALSDHEDTASEASHESWDVFKIYNEVKSRSVMAMAIVKGDVENGAKTEGEENKSEAGTHDDVIESPEPEAKPKAARRTRAASPVVKKRAREIASSEDSKPDVHEKRRCTRSAAKQASVSPSPSPTSSGGKKGQPQAIKPGGKGRLTGDELVTLFKAALGDGPKRAVFDDLIPGRTGKQLHDNWTKTIEPYIIKELQEKGKEK